MILRGGAEQFLEETERSLHDAIMIVRRACKSDSVVAGGGAIEMELSKVSFRKMFKNSNNFSTCATILEQSKERNKC